MGNAIGKDGLASFDDSKLPTYTMEQVREHSNKPSAWLVIEGRVFDVTAFIDQHPGGDAILDGLGKDATELFNGHGHSKDARNMLVPMAVGKLAAPSAL